MKQWESTGMEIYFSLDESEKPIKQQINAVIENPLDEDVLIFGQALAQLSPENQHYTSTVIVTKSRIIA